MQNVESWIRRLVARTEPFPQWVRRDRGRQLFVIGLLLLAVTCLVYLSGGTRSAAPHLMYVPILLASYRSFSVGGLATAILAGMLVGPLMPEDTALGLEQALPVWGGRLLMFMTIGGLHGFITESRAEEQAQVRRLLAESEASFGRILRTFAGVCASRDRRTQGHCERVARNSLTLGRGLGFDERWLQTLYWAATLHDLGKIAIPAHLLLKPGALSQDEFDEMKRHPKLGAEILLAASPQFEPIAEIILYHHERWDGSGYPTGRTGESIPLPARLLTVVDAFEAMTSDRPYRRALSVDRAAEELRRHAGSQFDPEIVSLFLDLLEQRQIELSYEYEAGELMEVPMSFAAD